MTFIMGLMDLFYLQTTNGLYAAMPSPFQSYYDPATATWKQLFVFAMPWFHGGNGTYVVVLDCANDRILMFEDIIQPLVSSCAVVFHRIS